MLLASRDFTSGASQSGGGWGSGLSGEAGTGAVVACKCALAYLKASLFLAAHPDSSTRRGLSGEAPSEAPRGGGGALSRGDGEETLRYGGAGVQVGGLVGSLLFFVLTVPLPVL
mmetsp:Transcript_6752/g.15476  ORF Transcript_6752/g.15476 Transcript_6752/m.15476 type:complete len:114 (+) Transcript_6752:505-846(+)